MKFKFEEPSGSLSEETPESTLVRSAEEARKIEAGYKERAGQVYAECIQEPEVYKALSILEKLPSNFTYHNIGHTHDVMRETILFALADGVDEKTEEGKATIFQQVIAAAWHDVGFIVQPTKNEQIAVDMFRETVRCGTLTEDQCKEVENNILSTAVVVKDGIPQVEDLNSILKYVLDADVSNFGREDFFELGNKLMREQGLDPENDEVTKNFRRFAIKLLENHEWKTDSARTLRSPQQQLNLIAAKKLFHEKYGEEA